MAIYTYRCVGCGKDEEVWQLISEYVIAPNVPFCDCVGDGVSRAMQRFFTPIQIAVDMPPFVSPVDGSVINGKAERREHMLKHGVVPTDEIMPDVVRNRKAMLESFKATTREDINKSIAMVEQGYVPRPDTMATATEVSIPDG